MTVSDITGARSVLVTGPTRGLGRALVDVLAAARPTPGLVLAGRDPAALAEVVAAAGPGAVGVEVDLADLASVRRAGAAVVADVVAGRRAPLTAVVANAGLQTVDRRHRSVDGHELTFAVNVIAQHQLLRALLPALAPGAHVVLLGSGTHYGDHRSMGLVPAPRWEDPADLARPDLGDDAGEPSAGGRAYATSKLAVVLLARAWQHRYGDRMRVTVYDPGMMPGTGLARDRTPWQQWLWRAVLPALRVLPGVTSPAASAQHLAALALGQSHPGLRGGYVVLGTVAQPAPAADDEARGARLWEVLEDLTSGPGRRGRPPADPPRAASPGRGR